MAGIHGGGDGTGREAVADRCDRHDSRRGERGRHATERLRKFIVRQARRHGKDGGRRAISMARRVRALEHDARAVELDDIAIRVHLDAELQHSLLNGMLFQRVDRPGGNAISGRD